MNRRELIIGALLVPLISTQYKTPPGIEAYERLIGENWVEYPFYEFQAGDIVRMVRIKEHSFKVDRVVPESFGQPAGLMVNVIV